MPTQHFHRYQGLWVYILSLSLSLSLHTLGPPEGSRPEALTLSLSLSLSLCTLGPPPKEEAAPRGARSSRFVGCSLSLYFALSFFRGGMRARGPPCDSRDPAVWSDGTAGRAIGSCVKTELRRRPLSLSLSLSLPLIICAHQHSKTTQKTKAKRTG